MKSRIRRFSASVSLAVVSVLAAHSALAAATIRFDVPAQPLAEAIRALASQANTNVMFDEPLVEGRTAEAVRMEGTLEEALTSLLADTGLTYRFVNDETVVLAGQFDAHPELNSRPFVNILAEEKAIPTSSEPRARNGTDTLSSNPSNSVQEVIVTGTHIRGATASTSPVTTFDRDEIDRSGLGTIQDFIQRLPQNFSSDSSETTASAVKGTTGNDVSGSAVNLRGLGADATLVLVNGRRLAPGNVGGNYIDVSMIPISAVDRVELVTDGASAIYGSDAVGGVVNFVLRRDLRGAETRARYGSVYRGDRQEIQVGQTLGNVWEEGSGLLSYEFRHSSSLDAAARGFSRTVPRPFTLLPTQTRHAVFGTISHAFSPSVEFFLDGAYAHRAMSAFTGGTGFSQKYKADIDTPSATAGARIEAFEQGQFEISASYSRSGTRREITNFGALQGDNDVDTSISTLDAKFDGSLAALPGGDLLYAIGAQFRREKYANNDLLVTSSLKLDRKVSAAFAELHVPILGPAVSTDRQPRLLLTIADRQEHYDHFGSTNNPEVGLLWKPVSAVSIRGTYGTSFKAPGLSQLDPTPLFVFPYPTFDPLSEGTTNTLIVFGGNPDLKPEKADIWTTGIDFMPQSLQGFRAHATYYDIRFRDRIAYPADSIPGGFFDSLRFESLLGPRIIQRDPSEDSIDQYVSSSSFVNPYTTDLSTIAAIFDARRQNLSFVKTSGIDFGMSYATDISLNYVELGIDGTYIRKFDTDITANSETLKLLDTAYNPLRMKIRSRALVNRGSLSLAAFINHANSYTNVVDGVSEKVSSWTTMDVTLGYRFNGVGTMLGETSLQFGILNVANSNPPYVFNPQFGVNFDGDNANPLGRFYTFQISTKL